MLHEAAIHTYHPDHTYFPLCRQAIPVGGVDITLREEALPDPSRRFGIHYQEARHQLLLPGTDTTLKASFWLGRP